MAPAYESTTHEKDKVQCQACPTPAEAWVWVELMAESALDGDDDSLRCLPAAVLHALRVEHGMPR
jgi:hypothetical protein